MAKTTVLDMTTYVPPTREQITSAAHALAEAARRADALEDLPDILEMIAYK